LELANIWGDFGPKIMVQEGESYGTIYGYDFVRHEDSGQPIVNEAGTHYLTTPNVVPVGNAAPKLIAGLNLEGKYKRFRYNILFDSKIGGDIYAGSYVIGLQTGQSPSTLVERDGGGLPYTDPDGNTRNVGVILPGVQADGTPNEEVVHYYYKYLPNAFSPRTISKLKVFQGLNVSLVGRDLFYLYSSIPDNINPEGANGSGNAQGLEWASLPSMRSFSLRIGAKF